MMKNIKCKYIEYVLISCFTIFLLNTDLVASIEMNESQNENISFKENDVKLYPTWRYKPEIRVSSNGVVFDGDSTQFNWTSSNQNVAYVNSNGNVIAVSPGNATLAASSANSNTATLSVSVQTPVLNLAYPQEDAFLKQPAPCSKQQMRVLILNYLPTTDGQFIDLNETGPDLGTNSISLMKMQSRLMQNNVQMKFMSEERTKFRGYKDASADAYLGYEIVEYINIYEPIPRFHKVKWRNQEDQFVSYFDMPNIAERFDWQNYVDNLDVDEIWIWAYHNDNPGGVFGSESEMSTPTTRDVSNSWYFNEETELPIYSKTYMVYWFNYGRTPNLHNHGHQLESIFKSINSNFFLNDFAAYGRCGDDHKPPNTTTDYDYLNPTQVLSDIENWLPSGGLQQLVNVDNWGNLNYNWPYGNPPNGEIREVNYYIYWMQNMPGYLNAIPNYNSGYMSNWWQFIADWDTYNYNTANLFQEAIKNGADCGKPCAPVCSSCSDSIKNQDETGIDCGGSCPPCATCNDGIKNQGETGIDCGGPCNSCSPTGCNVPNGFQNGVIVNRYQASQFIISPANGNKAVVEANTSASFNAGDYIDLRPGFTVNLGSRFDGFIDDCESLRLTQPVDNALDEFSIKIYPNPLNNEGFIEFNFIEDSTVDAFVADITGKKIINLLNGKTMKAGTHQLIFEQIDVPPGIYYFTLITGNKKQTKKLLLSP